MMSGSISCIVQDPEDCPQLLAVGATKFLRDGKLLVGRKFLEDSSGMSKRFKLLSFRDGDDLILKGYLDD